MSQIEIFGVAVCALVVIASIYALADRICRCVETCTMAKAYASTIVAQGGASTKLTDWLEMLDKAMKGGDKS